MHREGVSNSCSDFAPPCHPAKAGQYPRPQFVPQQYARTSAPREAELCMLPDFSARVCWLRSTRYRQSRWRGSPRRNLPARVTSPECWRPPVRAPIHWLQQSLPPNVSARWRDTYVERLVRVETFRSSVSLSRRSIARAR